MGLDSDLLNQEQESEAARELRQKKRGSSGEEVGDKAGPAGEEPKSLRQRAQAARQALNLKERAKKKLEEKVTAPAKAGTNGLLRWAWATLIPSWGLSLIYINIHVFLRMVLGDSLFCKLGEEWIPKKITEAGGESGKMAGKTIGVGEIFLWGLLNALVLAVVFVAGIILVLLVDIIVNPISTAWNFGWGAVFDAIKSLFN